MNEVARYCGIGQQSWRTLDGASHSRKQLVLCEAPPNAEAAMMASPTREPGSDPFKANNGT